MASKKTRKPNRASNKVGRIHFKNQPPQQNNTSTTIVSTICSSSTTLLSPQATNETVPSPSPAVQTSPVGGCCTPKAKKSRIPEMLTCPPAPKKQRVSENIVLRRRQIVFFTPPEIELFFVKAYDSMNNF